MTRRRASLPASAPRRIRGRRAGEGRAARARRPRRRGAHPRRGDVEGHAAAARDRAGAGRGAARCCCSTSRPARSIPVGRRIVRELLIELRERGRLGAPQLAPAQRGGAGLRPGDDHRPGAGGRRGTAGRAGAAARGGDRDRRRERGSIEGAGREDVPRIVAELVAAGERVYGVRVLGEHARGGLPRGGRGQDGMNAIARDQIGAAATIVGYALRESLRRRVFAVVIVLTAGFLVLYAVGAHFAFRDARSFAGTQRIRRPDRVHGSDHLRPGAVRDPLPRRGPGGLPDPRRRARRRRVGAASAADRAPARPPDDAAVAVRRRGRDLGGLRARRLPDRAPDHRGSPGTGGPTTSSARAWGWPPAWS